MQMFLCIYVIVIICLVQNCFSFSGLSADKTTLHFIDISVYVDLGCGLRFVGALDF